MRQTTIIGALSVVLTLAPPTLRAQEEPREEPSLGHSAHGEAFEVGPRQQPWKMTRIGKSHFPITSDHPEVQEWFDQGHTLLHNFWWHEAERSFRWCLKLDPECAMAYWGLSRATGRGFQQDKRHESFLKEAVQRKENVSERERMYIEAWEKAYFKDVEDLVEPPDQGDRPRPFKALADELEMIILKFPEDIEAKALFVLYSLYSSSRYGNEAVLQEILEQSPDHPGAHHYRIHNWDGEEGHYALESCDRYGRIASESGHANHMPGHIYSGIGMWHEAAIWMDSATRMEKRYMQKRMILPFHNWNYAHNRNYLSYIQEQLGMPSLSLDGGRQLIAAPLDPKYNSKEKPYSVHREGIRALVRGLIKFERWEAILEEDNIPWREGREDEVWRAYAEGLAHLGLGNLNEANEKLIELSDLREAPKKESTGRRGGSLTRFHTRMLRELGGRIELARGNDLDGVRLLTEAAKEQHENFHQENDPPSYPNLIYTALGESYLSRDSAGLAAPCFRKSLEVTPNDAFALSGLTRALHAQGKVEEAREAYGRFLAVWSDAEANLRWMTSLDDLGIKTQPASDPQRPERKYRTETLEAIGPQTWRPYPAPELEALDPENKTVTFDEYRGKNVLLVFYLGEKCVHCVEQLHALGEKASEFEKRNVELLAVSSNSPAEHASSLELGELPFRLLSDVDHENARRFKSYDDFEDLELHSTILVDGDGLIRWARSGGDPFMNVDFLLGEIDRIDEKNDLGTEERGGTAIESD